MKIYAAPLQGLTEHIWRNIHAELFGGIDAYYTPFIRLEKGSLRNKDIREIAPENNIGNHCIPQILAGNGEELERLVNEISQKGYDRIDINMGCPFPPIAKKGKGAGILQHPDKVAELCSIIKGHDEIKFSIKMRCGMESFDEWKRLADTINETPLEEVIMHPRIGTQQYKGDINMEAFEEFRKACAHPVVYNGDIRSLSDCNSLQERIPELYGIMIGRGLLANPELANEIRNNKEADTENTLRKIRTLHDLTLAEYCNTLHGETQILMKIKPYWEYLMPDMDRKARKKIMKSTSLDKYRATVNEAL